MAELQRKHYVPVGAITGFDDPKIRVNRANQRATSKSYTPTPTPEEPSATLQTILGLSRLQATVLRTNTGLARLQKTVLQTLSGQSRLQLSVLQAIYGISSISAGTLPPGPLDCPIPGADVEIAMPGTATTYSLALDTVNNRLWIIDEWDEFIYWVDVIPGTYGGAMSSSPYGAFGLADIQYDAANHQLGVIDYNGDMFFVDPDTATVTGGIPGLLINPAPRMLAVDDTGTFFATDQRNATFGALHVIDGAAQIKVAGASFATDSIYTDSICYANNIGKVVVNQDQPDGPLFFLYDRLANVFAASSGTGPESFRYEVEYLPTLGHILQSRDGGTHSYVLDISQGTDAPIIATVEANRISASCENTCTNTFFVHEGQDTIYEYSLDGNYTLLNTWGSYAPSDFAFSRKTSLAYYLDYDDAPMNVKSVHSP